MEAYYYSKMDKTKQAVYHAMLQGLLALEDSIPMPRLEAEDLYQVFFLLRLDHPEIFWATGYKYRYYPESANLVFLPEYLFEKGKIREHQKAMKARVEKLARAAQNLSEWEKEKYIHDFICENVHYDKLKKPYSHEIIGPLGQGVGVCEGIAKSVKVLCDALGIWCVIALCGNCPEKGIKYRHTWNIVKIGGQYYHLDATFDNTLGADEMRVLRRYRGDTVEFSPRGHEDGHGHHNEQYIHNRGRGEQPDRRRLFGDNADRLPPVFEARRQGASLRSQAYRIPDRAHRLDGDNRPRRRVLHKLGEEHIFAGADRVLYARCSDTCCVHRGEALAVRVLYHGRKAY